MPGYAIGYGLLVVLAVLLGLAVRRLLRRRSASCCSGGKTGGKAFHTGDTRHTG